MAEEAVEKAIKKSPLGRWLWTVSTILALPLLGWVGREALKTYSDMTTTLESLKDKIHDLERDRANNQAIWNAISETNHKTVEMRIEHESGMRHLHWITNNWLVLRAVNEAGKSEQPPLPVPKVEPTTFPKFDPSRFREEFEKKYPNPAQQQVPKK